MLVSMAGSEFQDILMTKFENDPRIGNHSEAGSNLNRVNTITENKVVMVLGGGGLGSSKSR